MRQRLTIATVAVVALVTLAFAIPLGAVVRTVARDRALAGAERDIAALAPVLALTADPELVESALERTPTGADDRLAVWLPNGTQVGDTAPVDADSLTLARERRRAFSTPLDGGLALFSPVVTGNGVAVVRARVPESLLEDGVAEAWLILAGVAVGLIVLAAVVADRLARTVTRPAQRLADTAQALAAGDLQSRADVDGPPEIAAVAASFNHLAGRIEELLAAERERVADLSHRIRTPLTALRLDAESLGRPEMIADVDRLEQSVDEIIRAARRPLAERVAVEPRGCDAAAVARERAEFWGPLAEDQEREWRLNVDADAGDHRVAVDADELASAVDVLVGNVFSHTPEGTAYAVSVASPEPSVVRLAVDDAGPGIADRAALERGVSGGGSTGLGLDIARRVAESAGGSLSIDRSPLGGARVVLDLPSSVASAAGAAGE